MQPENCRQFDEGTCVGSQAGGRSYSYRRSEFSIGKPLEWVSEQLLELRRSANLEAFLDDQLSDDSSELAVMGQRVLDAEFRVWVARHSSSR